MAEPKTKPTDKSVEEFLNSVPQEQKRRDAFAIMELMQDVTGSAPTMWGSSIVGFGSYRYKYASGREGDWFLTGFSPRKQSLTLYIMDGFEKYDELLQSLGKYKTGKSCLYVKRLEDVDMQALRQLVEESVKHMVESNAGAA